MSNDKHFPNKLTKARKISRFICQELLYDFIEGKLDDERKLAVEEYLKTDKDMQAELEGMKYSMDYCARLAETQISKPVFDKLKSEPSFVYYVKNFFDIKAWPESAKWIAEASLVSATVVLLGLFIPWDKIPFLNDSEKQTVVLVEKNKIPITKAENLEGETEAEAEAVNSVVEKKTKTKEIQEKKQAIEQPPAKVKKPVSKQVAAQFKKAEEKKSKTVKKSNGNAFIYRLYMNQKDVDIVTPKVVAKLKELGAVKAGKVVLGWRREKGSYFHFSIPETNYKQMLLALKEYGSVSSEKQDHRRVMPEGTVRVVLWMQEEQ